MEKPAVDTHTHTGKIWGTCKAVSKKRSLRLALWHSRVSFCHAANIPYRFQVQVSAAPFLIQFTAYSLKKQWRIIQVFELPHQQGRPGRNLAFGLVQLELLWPFVVAITAGYSNSLQWVLTVIWPYLIKLQMNMAHNPLIPYRNSHVCIKYVQQYSLLYSLWKNGILEIIHISINRKK